MIKKLNNTNNNIETNIIEDMKTEYQFISVPMKLFMCMDANCAKLFTTLIQLSSYYANEDGWFYRTNEMLQDDSKLCKKVVNAVLMELNHKNIILVNSIGQSKGKKPNYFKINFDEIDKWESLSIDECKNPNNSINTPNYNEKGFKINFVFPNMNPIMFPNMNPIMFPNMPTNIDNITNLDNIENLENNINNIENLNKEKENNILTNIIKEKESKIEVVEKRYNEEMVEKETKAEAEENKVKEYSIEDKTKLKEELNNMIEDAEKASSETMLLKKFYLIFDFIYKNSYFNVEERIEDIKPIFYKNLSKYNYSVSQKVIVLKEIINNLDKEYLNRRIN